MTVTFGDVELRDPEYPDETPDIALSKTRLLSGKIRVQSSTELGYNFSFQCHTDDRTDITNLFAVVGTSATLTIEGTSYTKCYIEKIKINGYFNNKWNYNVSFVRDTT